MFEYPDYFQLMMAMTTLMLLPGMDGTGLLFEPFITALKHEFKSEFRVKVVSYPTSKPLDYSELEVATRAAVPTEGSYFLLGESFSGPIVVSLAALGSQRLKGIILCCSFVRNPRPDLFGLRSFIPKLPLTWVPIVFLSHFLLGRFSTPGLRSALFQAHSQVSAEVFKERLRSIISVDVSAKLFALKIPILYLRASHDRVVPRSASEHVKQLNPSACIKQLRAPHFLLQTVPSDASREIGMFMREANGLPFTQHC